MNVGNIITRRTTGVTVSAGSYQFYIGATKVGAFDVNGNLRIKGAILTDESNP